MSAPDWLTAGASEVRKAQIERERRHKAQIEREHRRRLMEGTNRENG